MRVIQLGIGGMGNTWLNAARRSDVVEYAGFVEINDEIAREQAAAYGLDPANIYKTLPEALNKLDADAVIDVTPPAVSQGELANCSGSWLTGTFRKTVGEYAGRRASDRRQSARDGPYPHGRAELPLSSPGANDQGGAG